MSAPRKLVDAVRRHRVPLAYLLLLGWYAVSVLGVLARRSDPALSLAIDRAVNRDGHFGNPEGPVEHLEALFWFGAFVAFAIALHRAARGERRRVDPWLALMTVFCFVALGEELSWGQQLFHWRAPDAVRAVNFQQETNLHNLDLGAAAGLAKSSLSYRLLKLAVVLVNPAFALACALLWVVGPTLRERGVGVRWRAVRALPVPRRATRLFFAVAFLAYLVVDKLVADSGELLELALPMTALLAALDFSEARARAAAEPSAAARVAAA